MNATTTERLDLDVIESLDFNVCESRFHEVEVHFHAGPAYALVRVDACVSCGRAADTGYRCHPWTEIAMTFGYRCSACDGDNPASSVRILALVGGAR